MSGARADRLDAFPCVGPAATPTTHGQGGTRAADSGSVRGRASHGPALGGVAQTSPSLLQCCTAPMRAAILYLSSATAVRWGRAKGRGASTKQSPASVADWLDHNAHNTLFSDDSEPTCFCLGTSKPLACRASRVRHRRGVVSPSSPRPCTRAGAVGCQTGTGQWRKRGVLLSDEASRCCETRGWTRSHVTLLPVRMRRCLCGDWAVRAAVSRRNCVTRTVEPPYPPHVSPTAVRGGARCLWKPLAVDPHPRCRQGGSNMC